jgi:hypothetical protein
MDRSERPRLRSESDLEHQDATENAIDRRSVRGGQAAPGLETHYPLSVEDENTGSLHAAVEDGANGRLTFVISAWVRLPVAVQPFDRTQLLMKRLPPSLVIARSSDSGARLRKPPYVPRGGTVDPPQEGLFGLSG